MKETRDLVLVVDDDELYLELVKELALQELPGVRVLTSTTSEDGLKTFREHEGALKLVALDGKLRAEAGPDDSADTLPIAFAMRDSDTFHGVSFAISGSDKHNDELREAGCQKRCKKIELLRTLIDFFRGKFN